MPNTAKLVHDILEGKGADHAALEQLRLAETVFNHSVSCFVILDRNFNFVRVNAAYAQACHRDIRDFDGRNHFDLYPSDAKAIFEEVVRTKRPFETFTRAFTFADQPERGVTYWDWTLVPVLDPQGEVKYLVFSLNEVTERERAQGLLRESEEELQTIFDGTLDGMVVVEKETRKLLAANAAICSMLGYTHEEIVRIHIWDIHPKEHLPRVTKQLQRLQRGEIQMAPDIPLLHKDGSISYADMKASPIHLGGKDCVLSVFCDITQRKQADQQLIESEARFRGLVEQSIAGTYMIQDGRFAYVNPRFAEIFGYESAAELIGHDAASVVAEKDHATITENIRRRIEGEVASSSYDFTGRRKDGSMIHVGVHGTRAIHHGRPVVIGLVQDISEKKRAEDEIQRYVKQLKKAFMSTVEMATTLSEMRDPYTTGHERRVGDIAVAIAAELGFDAHRQEGLHVAGHLHDIGKITIPSEILSKPGKLSVLEYQLVQGHPQAGYDVLKRVDFPWPVAQIALQHHERMDGSGYPQGLKGEAILLDARILAVADVIEAMSSHRPYRPGLGIDKALAEIERGRRTAYDVDAANACLRLFHEKRYQLPE